MNVSPGKRRALAPLDNNAQSPITSLKKPPQPSEVKIPVSHDVHGSSSSNSGKRKSTTAVADEAEAVKKRQRGSAAAAAAASSLMVVTTSDESTGGPVSRDRETCSVSPEPSSIFDNSTVDTSLATCATDVEAEAEAEADTDTLAPSPPRLPRRPTITRSEARQHAEVLRLRLGLAGYKLRTGQEDLPFERLQVRREMVRKCRTLDKRLTTLPISYCGGDGAASTDTHRVDKHSDRRRSGGRAD